MNFNRSVADEQYAGPELQTNSLTGCTGDVWEGKEVWREWHRVLCVAKCVEVEGDRQLMTCFEDVELECVGKFAYLGDMLNDTGGVEQAVAVAVAARVKTVWVKFRELGGILCTQGASLRMKGLVYKACVRTILTYGAETFAMKVGVFRRLRTTERRMLIMICGVTLKDKMESTVTALKVEVDDLEEYLRQKRLRWFGHIVRRDEKEQFGDDVECITVSNEYNDVATMSWQGNTEHIVLENTMSEHGEVEHITDAESENNYVASLVNFKTHGPRMLISNADREQDGHCAIVNSGTLELREDSFTPVFDRDGHSTIQSLVTDVLCEHMPVENKQFGQYVIKKKTDTVNVENSEVQEDSLEPAMNELPDNTDDIQNVQDNTDELQDNTDDIQNNDTLKPLECSSEDGNKSLCMFACGICTEKFDKISKFYAHLKTHESFETIANSEKKFEIIEALNMQHKIDENVFKCGVCLIEFPSMSLLHDHMVSEENISDYSYSNVTHTATPCTRRIEKSEMEKNYRIMKSKARVCKKPNADLEEKTNGAKVYRGEVNKEISMARHFTLKEAYGKKSWQTIVASQNIQNEHRNENATLKKKSLFGITNCKKVKERNVSIKEECKKPELEEKVAKTAGGEHTDFSMFKIKEETIEKDELISTPSSCSRSCGYTTRRSNARDSRAKRVDYKVLAGLSSSKSETTQKNKDRNIKQGKPELKVDSLSEITNMHAAEIQKEDNHKKLTEHNEIESRVVEKDNEYDDGDDDDDFMDDDHDVNYKPEKEVALDNDDDNDVGTKDKLKKFIKDIKEKSHRKPGEARKLFACEVCGKIFDFKAMKRHKSAHSQIRNFKCPKCEKGYKSKQHVRDHIRSVHYVIKIRCQICQKVFRGKQSFAKHTTTHILKRDISDKALDEIEGEIVMDPNELMDWNTINDKVKVVNVPDSVKLDNGNIIAGSEVIGRLFDSTRENMFECPICHKFFANESNLLKHSIVHSDIRAFECQICHVAFKSDLHLRDHVKKAHVSTGPLSCDICGESAKNDYALWCHKSKHLMSSDPHYSEQVVQQLQAEEELRKKKKNTFLCERKVNCHECGLEVPNKRLKRHLETHTKTKEFQCELCKKFYKTLRYLKDHKKKTHGGKRSEVCNICGLSFKSKKYLFIHAQTHGPKDKVCDYCGKGFTTELYRKVHMQTHGEKKAFKCTDCSAGFTHRARLMIHMTEKHGKGDTKPCKYCGEDFPSRQKARFHERFVHEGYKPAKRLKSRSLQQRTVMSGNIQQTITLENGREYQVLLNTNNSHDSVEVMELEETADIKVIHIGDISGHQNMGEETANESSQIQIQVKGESGNSVGEQVLEIPENAQQCQILVYPDGTFKLLGTL